MRVHNTIILEIDADHLRSSNIGKKDQWKFNNLDIGVQHFSPGQKDIEILFFRRSTACPNVKHGDEWGEPSQCEQGDSCQYCHARTEQQFHPEIYKSTKCNDIQQNGYCPRGAFCAFAHLDRKWNTFMAALIPWISSYNLHIIVITLIYTNLL